MSRPLKYGQVSGPVAMHQFKIGATEYFYNLGGSWVVPDGSGRIEKAGAASVNIIGWALQGERSSNSTEGADKADVNTSIDAVYEMPACDNSGAALTEAVLLAAVGETVDIKMVSTYYQYANVGTQSTDILVIMGYRYYGSVVGQQSVLVRLNVTKLVYTGT